MRKLLVIVSWTLFVIAVGVACVQERVNAAFFVGCAIWFKLHADRL